MNLAMADMDIIEQLTEEHLEGKAGIIKESAIVLLDANLPEGIINFILDRFATGEGPLFFLDAVSAKKARRGASRRGAVDAVKLGRMEAAVLSGIEIPGLKEPDPKSSRVMPIIQEKLTEAANLLIGKGVRRVFITLGKDGVYAAGAGKGFFSPVRYVAPLNTTGGGDAFMAGLVYGTLRGWDEETIVSFSKAMAGITVQSKSAVSPEMSLDLVQKNLSLFS
jgi:pseudouridine kinase